MTQIRNAKTILLGLVIVLGIFAQTKSSNAQQLETLTVAGGCFWCVEADFETVDGVMEAVSGFSGGTVDNPTYKQVVKGGTGHIEVPHVQDEWGGFGEAQPVPGRPNQFGGKMAAITCRSISFGSAAEERAP